MEERLRLVLAGTVSFAIRRATARIKQQDLFLFSARAHFTQAPSFAVTRATASIAQQSWFQSQPSPTADTDDWGGRWRSSNGFALDENDVRGPACLNKMLICLCVYVAVGCTKHDCVSVHACAHMCILYMYTCIHSYILAYKHT